MVSNEISIGKVVTFYSYKGGVGRSMAMANIAVLLAKWGKKVLIIDWDLEAPGLEYFYYDRVNEKDQLNVIRKKKGVIDLILGRLEQDYQAKQINWDDYEIDLSKKIGLNGHGQLKLITSGQKDDDYIDRVRRFNYSTFYDSKDGGIFLEEIRSRWIFNNYDFVLIDSRTGLTESGGVCTIHMPDILLLLFTPNEQSLKGVIDVGERSIKKHELLPFDRYGLFQLFVPTRFDDLESTQQNEWLQTIDSAITPLVDWLPYSKETKSYILTIRELIGHIKIPYKARYAYGERLAVQEEQLAEPGSISHTYQTIAAIIGNNFASISDLTGNRDLFVQRAKGDEIKAEAEWLTRINLEKVEKQQLQDKLKIQEEQLTIQGTQLTDKKRARLRRTLFYIGILVFLAAIGIILRPKSTSTLSDADKEKILYDLFTSAFTDSTTLKTKLKSNTTLDLLNIYSNYYRLNNEDTAKLAVYKRTLDSAMRPVLQSTIARLYASMPDALYARNSFADTLDQFGNDQRIVTDDIFKDKLYSAYLEKQRQKIEKASLDNIISISAFTSDSTTFTVQYYENAFTLFPGGTNHPKNATINPSAFIKSVAQVTLNYDMKVIKAVPVDNITAVSNSRLFLLWGNKNASYSSYLSDLQAHGFRIQGAKYLYDTGRPDKQEIRYFHLADSVQAKIIAHYMTTKMGMPFPAVKYTDTTAFPGYYEIWFGR